MRFVARYSRSILWDNRIREVNLGVSETDPCPACQENNLEFLSGDLGQTADAALCGRSAVQINRITKSAIDLPQMASRWEGVGRVQTTRFFVRLFPDDTRSITLFRDGRVIVNGTDDVSEARVLYDRYVGG